MSPEIKLSNKPIHSGRPAKALPGKFWWVLLVLLSVFSMASVLAAPIEVFLLNHEQKQCANMIGGDEYADFQAPEPWQKVDPQGMIHTQFGSCNFDEVNDNKISIEACCQKLGYTYIGWIEPNGKEGILGPALLYPIIYFLGIPCGILIVVLLLYFFSVKRSISDQNTTGEQNES